MLLNWNSRNARQLFTRAILAFPALVALLVARNVPPEFQKAPAPQSSTIHSVSTLRASSSHDQRPRFDCNGLGWSVPVAQFLPFPPASLSTHLTSASQIFPTLHVKGFHYNRPPPLG